MKPLTKRQCLMVMDRLLTLSLTKRAELWSRILAYHFYTNAGHKNVAMCNLKCALNLLWPKVFKKPKL